MAQSPSSQLNTDVFQFIVNTLLKPFEERTEDETCQLVEILEDLEYFRTHISDLSEREDFIRDASQYFEYSFYAKGATICHQGDLPPDFGIILNGNAVMFEPKTKEELDAEVFSSTKMNCLEIYKQYARDNGVFRKFRRLQTLSPKRQFHKSLSKTRDFSNFEFEAAAVQEVVPADAVEEILKPSNSIIPYSISKYDLTLEEKYLFLTNGEGVKNYFKDGKATHKKRRELRAGMPVADIALTADLPYDYTVVATEDLHLFTIKREHFAKLYDNKSSHHKKKRKFLSVVFPTLPYDTVLNLCAHVEEKVYHNWEYIYEEGDKPNGIYIVKTGEVQLMKFGEDEKKIENMPCSLVIKEKPKARFMSKQKLNATMLDVGGVFGEEELIKRTTRRYTAKCNGPLVLLYVIPSHIYTEVIEGYFPLISEALKATMDPKSNHRKAQIKKGQKVADLNNYEEPPKPDAKEAMNITNEKIPEEFVKRRSPTIDLGSHKSTLCEERLSRMTKKTIEIKISKPKELKSQLSTSMTPRANANVNENKAHSKSPKNELLFPSSSVEDMQNMKTKLFKRYQKGPSNKKLLRKSSYFSEESANPKAATLRPSTAKNTAAMITFKASPPITNKDKKLNGTRTASSLVLDGMPEETGSLAKNFSSYYQNATVTPKKPNMAVLSSYSFSDIFRKSPKHSFDSQLLSTPKQGQSSHPHIKALSFNEHAISSFNTKTFKKAKFPIMEDFPKESTLQSIPTLNFEPSESMNDLAYSKLTEAVTNRSASETNKIFVFNKGFGETKVAVVKTQTPKSMILDANYNHIRKGPKIINFGSVERVQLRKCSIEN